MTTYFIIDFDSTFVSVEALDELSKITLKNNPEKEKIVKEIEHITNLGMEGKITFPESLEKRLKLFSPSRQDIEKLIKHLKKKITPSILRNKDFFEEHADHIYIISGGFKEYIFPVVDSFGISINHVLANEFLYKHDQVIGFDRKNYLAQEKGKVKQIKALGLKGDITVLGDGFTDYEIKKEFHNPSFWGASATPESLDMVNGKKDSGRARSSLARMTKEEKSTIQFFAFTENVSRESVIKHADAVVPNFDEFLYKNSLKASVSYPKNRIKVLLLENIDSLAVELFKKEGYIVETFSKALDEEELIKKIEDVSILGIRSKTEVTKKVLEAAKKLLAIGAFCIGTNQINLVESAKKGVVVFNAPFSNTRSVVELTIGEIIMLSRNIFDKSVSLHKGKWDKSATDSREVRGKTLGIIGYGNIGSQLSVLAEDLGMNVIFYNTSEKLALGNARKADSMAEVLKASDVVTIHVDGKPENKHLISEKEFKMMKEGVIFINNARGFIVDLNALEKNIKNGKVRGAALDVFPKEPKSNNEKFVSSLQNLPNIILTPHIGGSTEEAQRNIADFVTHRLNNFINAGDTTLSVNFPRLSLPKSFGHAQQHRREIHRLLHIHHNTAGVLANINHVFADHKINIEGQYLGTNNEIGYVISDVNSDYNNDVIEKLRAINGTIRLRVLY